MGVLINLFDVGLGLGIVLAILIDDSKARTENKNMWYNVFTCYPLET